MSNTNTLILESLGLVAVMVVFVLLLRAGYFLKISAYWAEMMEEMKKCTWPTWDELVGSTVLVIVAVAILGGVLIAPMGRWTQWSWPESEQALLEAGEEIADEQDLAPRTPDVSTAPTPSALSTELSPGAATT